MTVSQTERREILDCLAGRYPGAGPLWRFMPEVNFHIDRFLEGFVVRFMIAKPRGLGHSIKGRVAGFWQIRGKLTMTFDQALDYETAIDEREAHAGDGWDKILGVIETEA